MCPFYEWMYLKYPLYMYIVNINFSYSKTLSDILIRDLFGKETKCI